MERLNFSISINAPKEKVWKIMLEPESYRQWVDASWPGSYYEGEWKKGTEMRFLAGDNQGGTLASILDLRQNEFILANHIAVINSDGGEDRESDIAKGWIGSTESYTFTDRDGVTELVVEIKTSPEWVKMFTEGWPKALQALKKLCEKRVTA